MTQQSGTHGGTITGDGVRSRIALPWERQCDSRAHLDTQARKQNAARAVFPNTMLCPVVVMLLPVTWRPQMGVNVSAYWQTFRYPRSRTTLSLPKISTWSEVWVKLFSPTVLPQLARRKKATRQRGRQRVRETTAKAGAPDHDGAIRAGIAGADAVDCAPERANASAAVSARCRPNTD